ncbi:hypothetical protein [Roseiarcus sp.]|uniref:hypothetical protein n=1 Tax=Roseiarcus sp. TaxID=1969460 RepID=UPI003F99D787
MRAAAASLALLAAALPGLARAEDDPACAKFTEPLAYNACLASHGPKANNLRTAPGSGARRVDPEGERTSEAPRRAAPPAQVFRPRGRVHMEFRVR